MPEPLVEPTYEGRDVSAAQIGAGLGLLALMLAAVLLLLGFLFAEFRHRSIVGPARIPAPPFPRLERSELTDFPVYRRRQKELLESYGWVNRRAGRARIPVQRAMEILSHE